MLKIKLFRAITTTLIVLPIGLLANMSEAHARDYYGAISYSRRSRSHGYSYDYSSRGAAETRARRECEGYSGYGDCKTVVWFRNGCGALAKTPNGAYGSGWGANKSIARYNALRGCRKYGSNCRVVRWVCTTR